MKWCHIGQHTYIDNLEPKEWEPIFSIKYPGNIQMLLENMRKEGRCWLPGSIGQKTYGDINKIWERQNIPFRLRSDPPNAPWADAMKRLRLQTLEQWNASVTYHRSRRRVP